MALRAHFLQIIIPLFCASIFLFSCSTLPSDHDEEENDHHDHNGIAIEPEQAKKFGIETFTVQPGPFYDVIHTSGTIEVSPSDISSVVTKKSGILTLSPEIQTGSEVKAGQSIGSISSAGVEGGDVSQAAFANLEAAKAEYLRLKPLHEDGLVTTSSFREAERAYKEAQALAGKSSASSTVTLTSPISGTIQQLSALSGDFVEVGTPIAVVVKNSQMRLIADLPSRETAHLSELVTANFIPEGRKEAVKLSDIEGSKISSPTSSSAQNGYIPVYFSFMGNSLDYPAGFAEVFLLCAPRPDVISLPREALLEIQGNHYVYVKHGDHEYEKRLVTVGSSDGESVEIKEGLLSGEVVVSKGASVVRMAEVSAVAPPAHNHNH